MILRSLTKHVNDQNWFAVVLDLAIVVVGVFIGIQVSNWNTAANERALERAYVARLTDDISRSIEQVEASNRGMMEQAELATLIIDSLDACEVSIPDRDKFAKGIFSIGKFDTATLDRTTIDEMTSTGRLELIRDVKLREKISRLKQQIEYQQRIEPQFVARISPPVNYIYTKVSIDTEPGESTSPSAIVWKHLTGDIETICADPRFRASVSSTRMATLTMVRWNEAIASMMEDLHASLQSAARERGWDDTNAEESAP